MAEQLTSSLLNKLIAITDALTASGFPAAIGGGIALAFHAEPRFTNDIDINISADPTQIDDLLAALPDEIVVSDTDAASLRRDDQVRLRWPDPDEPITQGTPVDIFLPAHPTFHARLMERAELVELAGHRFRIVGATDLTILKVLFDRSKDWVDIEAMLEHGSVDVDEVVAWLTVLVGAKDKRVARLQRLGMSTST